MYYPGKIKYCLSRLYVKILFCHICFQLSLLFQQSSTDHVVDKRNDLTLVKSLFSPSVSQCFKKNSPQSFFVYLNKWWGFILRGLYSYTLTLHPSQVRKRIWLTVSEWLRGSEQLVCLSCGRTCWISTLVLEVWRAPNQTLALGQSEAVRFWCTNYPLGSQACDGCFKATEM